MNKCPMCNRKLYGEPSLGRYCKYCGYQNRTNEDLNIPKVEPTMMPLEKKTQIQKIVELSRKSVEEYEDFFYNYEEDTNIYARIKQEEETKKFLKKIITRMQKINEMSREEGAL